jgi:hypothetical protein
VRVLIACEFSGVMRRAFRALGHDAWSNDLLPAADGDKHHFQEDCRDVILREYWDMLIAHPTCTYLCNSGVRWLFGGKGDKRNMVRWDEMQRGAQFFKSFLDMWPEIPRVAVENPIMHHYAKDLIGRGPSQIVQPWFFGDPFFKATGWWLRGLPLLKPTDKLIPPKPSTERHKAWSAVHRASPGPNRWAERSATYPGHAAACAAQWGAT